MVEFRKVQRVGDSLMVSIPSKIVEKLNIERGDNLRFDLVEDKIIIRTVKTDEFLRINLREEKEAVKA